MESENQNTDEVKPTTSSPKKTKKKFILSTFISILILSLLTSTIVLAIQVSQLKKEVADNNKVANSNITPIPKNQDNTAIIVTPTQNSELKSLDPTWDLYTNYKLGFSLKVPKVSTATATCVWKGEDQGDHSYRPTYGLVPVKIFEDENSVYINHEYRYNLTGKTTEGGISYFSGCEKEEITLDVLKSSKGPLTWHIITETVSNDGELETFIGKYFHPSCQLGEKKQSDQEGVLDVTIRGTDPTIGDENTCWLNYWYVVKYSPEKQRAYTWDVGQDATFYIEGSSENYTSEMVDSFTIL